MQTSNGKPEMSGEDSTSKKNLAVMNINKLVKYRL